MTDELRFAVTITAEGEVRDKDGNLLSSQPIEQTVEMTETELSRLIGEPQQ